MTVAEFLIYAAQRLKTTGNTSSRLDAELILAYLLGHNRSWLLAHSTDILSQSDRQAATKLLERRVAKEPLAYITGSKEFYGLKLAVDDRVLIPRPETERLVEYAVSTATKHARVLELGTGSGAISVALAKQRPDLTLFASDISPAALDVARANAIAHGVSITFFESDLLTNINVAEPIHLILANLPYVYTDIAQHEELEYEPHLALAGGQDGLDLYRKLFAQLRSFPNLTGDHELVVEYDPAQRTWFETLARDYGYSTQHLSDFVSVCKPTS